MPKASLTARPLLVEHYVVLLSIGGALRLPVSP